MSKPNLRAQLANESGNPATLDSHLALIRTENGIKCMEDQEFDTAYEQTIKAQASVEKFNRALYEMKQTNPGHAVLKLLEHELRIVKKEMQNV